MSTTTGSRRFAVPLALTALLALPSIARAQDGIGGKGEKAAEKEGAAEETAAPPTASAPKGKIEEPPPEVKGNRYRITLKSGAKIEGILPQGLYWEKRDQYGEFVDAKEGEKGALLRLNYVLNMEGDICINGADIGDIRDLGALTLEQKLAIQEMVLAARKKNIQERDRILREEMARQAAAARESGKETRKEEEKSGAKDGSAEKGEKGTKKEDVSEADQKKGDDLLAKYPPPEWGQKRLSDILRREVVNGIFRNDLEAEFIVNFQLWKDALARREKAEAEAEAKEKEEGGETEGEKKDAETGGKEGK